MPPSERSRGSNSPPSPTSQHPHSPHSPPSPTHPSYPPHSHHHHHHHPPPPLSPTLKRPLPPSSTHPTSPVKKQTKWTPDEDALIISLRGAGEKWEDISRRLPGRSAISCRLHYQNYLERRSEWDEEKKNRLARLYERFKPEMWQVIAGEMGIPWRAAEAMHWQLGEKDMAHRAGVVPFSLSSVAIDAPKKRGGGGRRKSGSPASTTQGSASPTTMPTGYAVGGPGMPSESERGVYRVSPGRSPEYR